MGTGHADAPALPLAPFEVIGGVERRNTQRQRVFERFGITI
jgi:hypothetical protein